jgi:hypothetical protein
VDGLQDGELFNLQDATFLKGLIQISVTVILPDAAHRAGRAGV